MPKNNDVLQDFLKEQFPSKLIEAVELLATLKYPVHDRKSLRLQLEKYKEEDENDSDDEQLAARAALADRVLGTYEVVDFSLDTLQSALEKFFARRPRIDASPIIPWPAGPIWDPYLPEEPQLNFPLSRYFGNDVCGRTAAELWREHLEDPTTDRFGESPAYHFVLEQGVERCRRTQRPRFRGFCRHFMDRAYLRCLVGTPRGEYSPRLCMDAAELALAQCRGLDDPVDDPFGDRRPIWP